MNTQVREWGNNQDKIHEVNIENIQYASLLRANIIKLSTIWLLKIDFIDEIELITCIWVAATQKKKIR